MQIEIAVHMSYVYEQICNSNGYADSIRINTVHHKCILYCILCDSTIYLQNKKHIMQIKENK